MIATDKLLFLHLHKSGGTFVNQLLLHCVPSARQLGYHLPYRETPPPYRGLPVLGTVRNPWAYYVSWYHFQAAQAEPNILFMVCSDERKLGFKETIGNLINLEADEPRLANLREGLPDQFLDYGLNLTKACADDLRGSGRGFYSFLYHRLYEGARNPMILPMEGLRGGLRSALTAVGQMPNPNIDRFLDEVPPLNVTPHDQPATYFDDELAALVADRDRAIVDKYGYVL